MREPGRYDALRNAEHEAAAERQGALKAEFRESGTTMTSHVAAPAIAEPAQQQDISNAKAATPEPVNQIDLAEAHEAKLLEGIQAMRTDGKSNTGDIRDYVRRENEKFDKQQTKGNASAEMTDAQQAKLTRLMGGMTNEASQDHEQGLEGGRDSRER